MTEQTTEQTATGGDPEWAALIGRALTMHPDASKLACDAYQRGITAGVDRMQPEAEQLLRRVAEQDAVVATLHRLLDERGDAIDRLTAELEQARRNIAANDQQIATIKTHYQRRTETLTRRCDGKAAEIDRQMAEVTRVTAALDEMRAERDRYAAELAALRAEPIHYWPVRKINHDETRPVGPWITPTGWIGRSAGTGDPAYTRVYAALLLAAADEAERRAQATPEQPQPTDGAPLDATGIAS